jgi:hypothetical protein
VNGQFILAFAAISAFLFSSGSLFAQNSVPHATPRSGLSDENAWDDESEFPKESASQTKVWVNTKSGLYFYPGARWYGKTKQGKYMTEAQARAKGYRAPDMKSASPAGQSSPRLNRHRAQDAVASIQTGKRDTSTQTGLGSAWMIRKCHKRISSYEIILSKQQSKDSNQDASKQHSQS